MVGATVTPVTSSDVAAALVKKAALARACEATAMNASSSRSHSVLMLAITGRHEASGTHLKGALNLVDLAGRYKARLINILNLSWNTCAHGCT